MRIHMSLRLVSVLVLAYVCVHPSTASGPLSSSRPSLSHTHASSIPSPQASDDLNAAERRQVNAVKIPFIGLVELANPKHSELSREYANQTLGHFRTANALDEDVRRIWVFGSRKGSIRDNQRFYLPTRFLSVLRKGKDFVLLPGDHAPTREFADFVKDVIGFDADQIIYTSGRYAALDDDIIHDQVLQTFLRKIVLDNPQDRFMIVPYIATHNLYKWAHHFQDLGVEVFGESTEWVEKFGHKGILHRRMSNLSEPCVIELIDPSIPVAKGYTCSTTEELILAYKMLNCSQVIIKPLLGTAGDGIVFASSDEEIRAYAFPMGDVVLEELLTLDKDQEGDESGNGNALVVAPAVHYMRGKLLGSHLVDQILEGPTYMGWRYSVVEDQFKQQVMSITQKIMEYTKPQGPGGFDFLSVGNLPILSDVNTGRFNGAHQPKLFLEMYAPDAQWYCWKATPPAHLHIRRFWSGLERLGLAFHPGKSSRGVFPLTFARGLAGTFISVGETRELCLQQYHIAKRLMEEQANTTSDTDPLDA